MILPGVADFEGRGKGPWNRECRWSPEARNGPQLTKSKEIETDFYN